MEHYLTEYGIYAIIVLGFLEACCLPIPSEVTFGFGGVLAFRGHLNLAEVIIIGSLAELAGSYASYYIGRRGGRPLVNKLGRYVLVTESDVNRAERFLEGRGAWAVSVGRMLPFVRAFTSIVAGLIRLPALRFGILSLIGTVIYAAALSSIGYGLGSAWESVNKGLTVVGYVLFALIVVAIVGFVLYRLRQFRREDRLRRSGSLSTDPGTGAGTAGSMATLGVGFPAGTAGSTATLGVGFPAGTAGSTATPGVGFPAGTAGAAGPGGPSANPAAASAAERPAKPHSHRAS
jgi:membrane protein DedA with SNARE-associated domain